MCSFHALFYREHDIQQEYFLLFYLLRRIRNASRNVFNEITETAQVTSAKHTSTFDKSRKKNIDREIKIPESTCAKIKERERVREKSSWSRALSATVKIGGVW